MKFDPQKHHRRSIRLKDYDYSQAGAYYVTIDVQNRQCLFGNIVHDEMMLNEAGKMIDEQWNALLRNHAQSFSWNHCDRRGIPCGCPSCGRPDTQPDFG